MITDPTEVADRVRSGLRLRRCRPGQILGYREHRSLVVGLDTDTGPMVAKVTGDDGAARTAAALAALAAIPAADLLPLRVPRLLLHDAAADLVVTEHVTGPSLAEHLAAGDLAAVHLAGRAIARLHGAPVIVGPRRDLAGHVTDLIRPQPLALAAAVPALAGQIAALLDGLAECLSTTDAAQQARPVHRDLHPRQLIVQRDAGGGSVVLLDWDLAAQGDPALDVGNLRGWLHHRHPADRAGAAALAFEDGYAQLGDPTVLDRADPYMAFSRLRLAVKTFRLDGTAALPVVKHLLDGATSLLAEEHLHAAV